MRKKCCGKRQSEEFLKVEVELWNYVITLDNIMNDYLII